MPPILDPTRLYDYLTRSRARVLTWAGSLSPEQYTREFPIGPGSLAKVLNHILLGEWYYVLRMLERDVPPIEDIIAREQQIPTLPELRAAWEAQSRETLAAFEAVPDWNAELTYLATDDQTGTTRRITATPADIASQLVLHEIHHRAQALNILRHLGVKTEDIDYNLLTYQITEL